ncbi:TVP38/TMEM64 family protein [Paenibacillus sp. ACRRX]|uniref:TVP38/TMEM64 family protein n=1 Tax=unclassified Paenibacillus TaxID=185978 RepID=UPI001EF4F0E0|nr:MULTISPECIES: TVP38/TMEM64 family protein [unclassified Paenibacillus]MCG7408622.1 TVP38/TMEM64 family protein [Paenibacillus sp. ACRRX]MDK8182867.1 TVP38/TMEM64 family protein [Paenibacillus sp. UMB4589-SE434]
MWDWLQQVITTLKHIDMNQVELWLKQYSNLGPIPGIMLPFLEAFLPFLPLIVFVMANAAAYGLWLGFLYSWIGVCAGSFAIFWIARLFGGRFNAYVQRKMPGTKRFFHWIETKGFTPIFVLLCFPFTPSSLINVAAGLSTLQFRTFMIAVLAGKSLMIFMMAFIGHDWQGFIHQPWRIALAIAVFALLWFGGKKLEARYHTT